MYFGELQEYHFCLRDLVWINWNLIYWEDDFLKRVVIIGAGASGMMAAKVAGDRGYKVTVLEKQKRCGQKLLITGKGRCNITNNCEIEELIENVPTNGKFLYSAFYTFTNDQVIDMFNDLGVIKFQSR